MQSKDKYNLPPNKTQNTLPTIREKDSSWKPLSGCHPTTKTAKTFYDPSLPPEFQATQLLRQHSPHMSAQNLKAHVCNILSTIYPLHTPQDIHILFCQAFTRLRQEIACTTSTNTSPASTILWAESVQALQKKTTPMVAICHVTDIQHHILSSD